MDMLKGMGHFIIFVVNSSGIWVCKDSVNAHIELSRNIFSIL